MLMFCGTSMSACMMRAAQQLTLKGEAECRGGAVYADTVQLLT